MRIVFLGIALLINVTAHAGYSKPHYIKTIKAQTNGVFITLDGFVNEDESVSCGSNSFWMNEEDNVNYQTRISFLLAAYMANRKVEITYQGCSNGHIGLRNVFIWD